MKKIVAVLLGCALLLSISTSVSALGLNKYTFTLGPFQVESSFFVTSRSDTEVETIGEHYGLISLAGIVSDDLLSRNSRKKLDEATVKYMAPKLEEEGFTVTVYKSSHDLYGLHYLQMMGTTGVLTIMIVSGQDCLLITTTLDEEFLDASFVDYHARSIMDSVSLI